ncbi:MAG: hypothetical protein COB67_09505 [SAR324 cluster bacterium]|uniref:Flagellar motor switch protein FliN-like C-terminal domain-containing protein n=1 Tax=SAR324 cluster bacterium TaxID=2024889 RepID=A0A2A4T0P8_9DELT|nr:MAG: hypothetical protein COB67_09505 [SAR324 cluster bacterium]
MAGNSLDDDLYGDSGPRSAKDLWAEEGEEIEVPEGEVEFIHDVPLKLIAQIGSVQKTMKEVVDLKPGHIIEFTKVVGEPMDVLIGGRLMCRGEIVVVNERYGIRISEVVRADDSRKGEA